MTVTQKGYEWLNDEPGPKELLAAISFFGIHEVLGPKNNPTIMAWAKLVHTTYPGDATAWCGLFRAVCAHTAGFDDHPNGNCLWALNWASWGVGRPGLVAMLGDTLVKQRKGGGHVTMYVGEDDPKQLPKGVEVHYHCLGGNQSDQVNIVRIPKSDFVAVRHAPWKVAQPDNVRRIFLSPAGAPTGATEA
jgi:uncharacterized protein (TIGR02594 family)